MTLVQLQSLKSFSQHIYEMASDRQQLTEAEETASQDATRMIQAEIDSLPPQPVIAEDPTKDMDPKK